MHEIRCTADRTTVTDRLARRSGGMSDADAVIAAAMAAAAAPWPEATDVATDKPTSDALDRALAVVRSDLQKV